MYKFFAKLCSYFNGLKDGILLSLVPISAIIGGICIIVAIIQNKSMRTYVELASESVDRERVRYSDYAKPEKKHKTKMGFNLD